MMSRSLTESARRRAEPASSTRAAAGCSRRLATIRSPMSSALVSRIRGAGASAIPASSAASSSSNFAPKPRSAAQLAAPRRGPQRVQRVDAQLVEQPPRALGPQPRQVRQVDQARRVLGAELLAGGMSPGLQQRAIFSSSVLPIPAARSRGPRAPARRPTRRLADGLGGVAVRDHAVDDRAVELVEVGQLVESAAIVALGDQVGRARSRRTAARRCPAPPSGSSSRPTTRPRTSRRSRPRARDAQRGPDGFRILVVDDASPDGTGAIADALAAAHREVEVLHRRAARGPRPGLPRRLRARARPAARSSCSRWTPTARTTPPTCAAADRRRRRRRPRARLALRRRAAASPTGGPCAARSAAAAAWYARAVLGVRGARPHRRLQVLPPRGARGDRPLDGALARLRLPGRAHLPRAARGFRVVEVPIVFRDRRLGPVEDVVADRARGGLGRAGAALYPRGRTCRNHAPEHGAHGAGPWLGRLPWRSRRRRCRRRWSPGSRRSRRRHSPIVRGYTF